MSAPSIQPARLGPSAEARLRGTAVDLLRIAFHQLKRRAAPGVDGITWHEYEADLEANLADLHGRVQRGAYRAKPSRRQYIPKPDGRQRPLGIAALEDKIVQRAVVEVLNAIYETDFLGFSYGFRPGRSQHQALDALVVGIYRRRINWILDADIRSFLETASQCPVVHARGLKRSGCWSMTLMHSLFSCRSGREPRRARRA